MQKKYFLLFLLFDYTLINDSCQNILVITKIFVKNPCMIKMK